MTSSCWTAGRPKCCRSSAGPSPRSAYAPAPDQSAWAPGGAGVWTEERRERSDWSDEGRRRAKSPRAARAERAPALQLRPWLPSCCCDTAVPPPTPTAALAGRRPVELDDVGRAQATAVGERLRGLPLAAVVTSPLIRCRQTVELALPGARAAVEERLTECGYGDWEGQPLKKLAKDPLWQVVQQHPSAVVFPGGEAMAAMSARAVAAVRRLGRPGHRRARAGRGLAGLQPRRCDQGDRGRRAGRTPRPVPADRGRPGVGHRDPLHPDAAVPACGSTTPAATWPALVPPKRHGGAATAAARRPTRRSAAVPDRGRSVSGWPVGAAPRAGRIGSWV